MQMASYILGEFHLKKIIRLNHEKLESQLLITGARTASHPEKTWKNFQNLLPGRRLKRLILSVFPRVLLWLVLILIIFQRANLFRGPLLNSWEILRGNIIYISLQVSWKEKET